MPKQVDHEFRRRQVAEIAANVIAAGGVDALTVRKVAEAANYSTAIVSHYFTDKRDLLVSAYRAAADRARARFEAAATDADPLWSSLDALLPVDDERWREWRLWLAFWGPAAADEAFALEQRDRARSARARIERVVRGERARGRLPAGTDVGFTARRLLVVVHGIGMQAMFDRAYWTPHRQREMLTAELDGLRAPGSSVAAG